MVKIYCSKLYPASYWVIFWCVALYRSSHDQNLLFKVVPCQFLSHILVCSVVPLQSRSKSVVQSCTLPVLELHAGALRFTTPHSVVPCCFTLVIIIFHCSRLFRASCWVTFQCVVLHHKSHCHILLHHVLPGQLLSHIRMHSVAPCQSLTLSRSVAPRFTEPVVKSNSDA